MNNYVKYGKTYHFPWSEGVKNDDKVQHDLSMLEGKEVIATEKMDGENCSIYSDYCHARSVNSQEHWTRKKMYELQKRIGDGLWSDKQKEVRLKSIDITVYTDDDEDINSLDFDPDGKCGSANIEFDTSTWDVDTDGLIYTDSVIEKINELLAEQLGYSNDTEEALHWSEQGMQGDDYLNFDVDLNATIWALLVSAPSE